MWSLVTGNTFVYCERIVVKETVRLERASVYGSYCQQDYFSAISTVTRELTFLSLPIAVSNAKDLLANAKIRKECDTN